MIRFELVSATGSKYDGDAYEVLLPAQGGTIAVFEDHMPLISAAQPGVVSVRKNPGDKDDDLQQFAVNGGVLEVDGKTLRLITEGVTAPEDVSEKEAAAAMARAEELIANAGSRTALAEAHRILHHSHAQLQVAKFKNRRHP